MESENENGAVKDADLASMQTNLFPPKLTSGSYFSNFLVKCNQLYTEIDEDDDKYKVKESISSKDLFPYNKDTVFTSQQPRWPTECQVLDEKIRHIAYVPASIEPYYAVTGNEVQPKPIGDECGIIIYQYTPISAVNYFSRSSIGGSKYLLSTNPSPEEDSLQFESRFECGNLARAIKITPNYYELHLRSDLYTNRHMQWFYFRVTNMKKRFLYRFSITNCSKENSLYNEGMKPLMYSTKDSQLHSIGWKRCGDNITYFCNENCNPEDPDQQMTYTLTFTLEFPHDDDVVYLAHCYPYTYTDLQEYLSELSSHPVKSTFTNVRLLCKSLAGNNVYYITVTSPQVPGEMKKKRAVVISARVHPGETPSSWMMKGILDFLTSDSGPAKELRDKFIFKLVPMLNPDGVIVGNNRCSLSAKDLNRQYRTVIRDTYPSIWYTKLMVRRLLEECGVAMYCDLHAHSRKHNIFIYGCENKRCNERKLQEQVFPLMLHKNTADKFSFESCTFRIQKAKEGTGRVVMWMMGIANSYTMEASFAGSTLGNRTETHFTTQDYEMMGKSFCQTLLDFYDEDPRKEKLRLKIIDRLAKGGSNADEPTNIRLSDYSSDDGDTSSTSSNEVGRDDDFYLPVVPPPSPSLQTKKTKIRTAIKAKIATKTPPLSRKPLPICKATLRLSLSEKNSVDSCSDSDYENDKIPREKTKILHRRRKKKNTKRKPKVQLNVEEHSDTDILVKTSKTTTKRSVSVFELLPNDAKLSSNANFSGSSVKTAQPKFFHEKKIDIAKQLAEVQAKLFTLKNKLWFGLESNEGPLSWGTETSTFHRRTKKILKKKTVKSNKIETKEEKSKAATKEKHQKKKQNGLKRQSAIDWTNSVDDYRIRKSKSLPDTCNEYAIWTSDNNETNKKSANEKPEKKKTKKRVKSVKKSKTVALN